MDIIDFFAGCRVFGVFDLFTVTVESGFSAEHQLTYAGGEKEVLHGHQWVVRVAVSAQRLDESGLAVDFVELKGHVEDIIAPFKGSRLEELACFEGGNASAEVVAKYIYDKTAERLPTYIKLEYVEVMEAAGCWAKYSV